MRRIVLSALVAAAIVLPRIAHAQGHPDFSGTWTMDTAKSDPPPQGRGGRGGGVGGGGRGGPTTAVSKVRWDGAKLVIETTREIQGFNLTTKEVRSLAADGKEMTVDSATSTPQGDLNRKVVYSKTP